MRRTVLFVWAVIALLAAVAALAPDGDVAVGPLSVRLPRLADVLGGSRSADSLFSVEDQLAAVEADMQLRATADSSASAASDSMESVKSDTLRLYENFFRSSAASIVFPNGDYEYLFSFFEAAESAASEAVHVIHYGDSQIEGDRITGLLRDSLQNVFGGSGPGLLPLWQPIPSRAVSQSLSDSVSTFYAGGMMGQRATHSRYGAMAQMAQLSADHVLMDVVARQCGGFRHVCAFVGHTGDSLTMRIGNVAHDSEPGARQALQTLEWSLPRCDNFSLDINGTGDVYGIEVDGGRGVSVSNIPMRGSDGTFFSRMDASLTGKMLRALRTKLILLEFGGNAMPLLKDSSQVDRYVSMFGAQISLVQNLVPDAAIIVIGPADMSIKQGTDMVSYPLLPCLVDALKAEAARQGVAYWDMFRVMGGKNSMPAWVDHKPQWAAPDYIHFTTRGANRIATVFWDAIRANYNYFSLVRNNR